ncbi:MAG TPA: hypothetical protein V6D29_06855 [Leptolyngbyaceae cyanobacterium]
MTTGPTDRLDRIEAILAQVAESQQRTQQITESNARAIEANSNAITQMREELQQADERSRQRLEETTADVVNMISGLGQQLEETDNRFNVLLEEARADRQEWQQQAAANETEHRAFRQNIQILLAEISRIWQRLAG